MTNSTAYPNAIMAMTRWASALVPDEESHLWLPALSKVALVWNEVISSHTRKVMYSSLSNKAKGTLQATFNQISTNYGTEAAHAARVLTQVFTTTGKQSEVHQVVNQLLEEAGHRTLRRQKINQHQRRIGRHLINRLTGVRPGETMLWLTHEGREGLAALALIEEPFSSLEKLSLSIVMLDGVSQFHSERLEPGEGFSAEKMFVSYDFSIFVPRLPPTELPQLYSPERKTAQKIAPPGDVWALGKIFISLFTGQPLDDELALGDEIPLDFQRVLERCIHPDDSERLYSAREVKVVMNGPLKAWEERLKYEEEQESGETEALPYDELTAEREQQNEERVRDRRVKEVKLRHEIQWKATRRQGIVIAGFVILLALIYNQYALDQAQKNARYNAKVSQIVKLSEALDVETQIYQGDLPSGLAETGFKWRKISGDQESTDFLVSTTEVTYSQYKVCVDAGECKALEIYEGCVWGAEGHENDPVNCLDFYQARSFAKFAGGDLPYVEQWMWAATHNGVHKYPWGNDNITQQHANLDFDGYWWETAIRPVCTYRLGDSIKGLCDMVGSVSEWVIISETGEIGSYYQLRTGIMGGSWLMAPEVINLNRPLRVNPDIARFDVGLRVVKKIQQAQTKRSPEPPAQIQDKAIKPTEG